MRSQAEGRRLLLVDGARPRLVRALRWTRWTDASEGSDAARARQGSPPWPVGATRGQPPGTAQLSARAQEWLDGALLGWDRATGVPAVVVLRPVAAQGATVDPHRAASHSLVLARELAPLLAPGSRADDFAVHSNEAHDGLRTVVLAQSSCGLPVAGAELRVRFRADRMFLVTSTLLPVGACERALASGSSLLDETTAARAAADALRADGVADARVETVGATMRLPVVTEQGVRDVYVVVPVELTSRVHRGRWLAYVEASSGRAIARRSLLWHAVTSVLIDAPERYAASSRALFAAPFLDVTVDGEPSTTDEAGGLVLPDGSPVEVTTSVIGPRVRVTTATGDQAARAFALEPSAELVWSEGDDERLDAQLSAFVHASVAKAHAEALAPELAWLDQQLRVEVNVDDVCNAYYDGYALHFYRAGSGCENTARIADVVYHEFGHALHHRSMTGAAASYDEPLSEGLSDYFAASITGDPGMGRGFYRDEEPLRDLDPQGREAFWPDDVSDDPHKTGLILAGALWDLRKALEGELGETLGPEHADRLFMAIARNAADIPSSYVEALAADDDDGDLLDGTPNGCAINAAFGMHGLRAVGVEIDAPATTVDAAGTTVIVQVAPLLAPCDGEQIGRVLLDWRLRRDGSPVQRIEMDGGPEQFSATLPSADPGSVVQYRVTLELHDGTSIARPDNPAAPYYELYVGESDPIYCTDFETDPWADGWTHGLSAGTEQEGADDWQWNSPRGNSQNGDPTAAFSGGRVVGNDLGHGDYNGSYQPDKTNWAATPAIAVGGYESVRLQYRRWLNVEDGYYDRATIYGNDEPLWANRDSEQGEASATHHRDREWRFHDVDLTDTVRDGTVTVRFELASDGGLELGGWTLDDLCIVGTHPPSQETERCGDGLLDADEQCDDGNVDDGDGCDHLCQDEVAMAAPPSALLSPSGGCACSTGARSATASAEWLVAAIAAAAAASRRGRRRPRARVRSTPAGRAT